MKNLANDEYVAIWIDEQIPILYSTILKAPETTELFKVLNERQLSIIKEMAKRYHAVFSICDASSLQVYSFDLLVNYFCEVLPKQIEAGLTLKVIVKPQFIISPIGLMNVSRDIGNLPIGIFDSLSEGYDHIKSEWLKESKRSDKESLL